MACGSCGGSRPSNTEYLVTLRDGTERRVATASEARIVIGQDTTTDPNGRRLSGSMRLVAKLKRG